MKKTKSLEILIQSHDIEHYKRLDTFLAHKLPDCSRTFIKHLFLQGLITSDGKKLELKKMPIEGSIVQVSLPEPTSLELVAEDIPLEILYEDEYLIVVNKPAGLTTHPAPGHYTGTLVHAILHHCPSVKSVGHKSRPGIVHRLDKGTGGVLVVAKEQKAYEGLSSLFSSHSIDRQYECLVRGRPLHDQGTLQSSLGRHPFKRQKMAVNVKGGKNAVTHYKILEKLGRCSHLHMTLETGRTHQIRVHLSSLLKTPILNDATYGHPSQDRMLLGDIVAETLGDYKHPLLYAKILSFIHPITERPLFFETNPPEIFHKVTNALKDSGA